MNWFKKLLKIVSWKASYDLLSYFKTILDKKN